MLVPVISSTGVGFEYIYPHDFDENAELDEIEEFVDRMRDSLKRLQDRGFSEEYRRNLLMSRFSDYVCRDLGIVFMDEENVAVERILDAIEERYGDQRSEVQLWRNFLDMSQQRKESARDYSRELNHAFRSLQRRKKKVPAMNVHSHMLRDHLIETLRDRLLRRMCREKVVSNKNCTFSDIREFLIRWEEESYFTYPPFHAESETESEETPLSDPAPTLVVTSSANLAARSLAARTIQRWLRSHLEQRQRQREIERVEAAVVLQKIWRGRQVRAHVEKTKEQLRQVMLSLYVLTLTDIVRQRSEELMKNSSITETTHNVAMSPSKASCNNATLAQCSQQPHTSPIVLKPDLHQESVTTDNASSSQTMPVSDIPEHEKMTNIAERVATWCLLFFYLFSSFMLQPCAVDYGHKKATEPTGMRKQRKHRSAPMTINTGTKQRFIVREIIRHNFISSETIMTLTCVGPAILPPVRGSPLVTLYHVPVVWTVYYAADTVFE